MCQQSLLPEGLYIKLSDSHSKLVWDFAATHNVRELHWLAVSLLRIFHFFLCKLARGPSVILQALCPGLVAFCTSQILSRVHNFRMTIVENLPIVAPVSSCAVVDKSRVIATGLV